MKGINPLPKKTMQGRKGKSSKIWITIIMYEENNSKNKDTLERVLKNKKYANIDKRKYYV